MSTKLKLMGVDVASFGDALATTEGALEVAVSNPVAGAYAKLVLDDRAETVLGGVLVGDASRYGVLRTMVGKPLTGDPVALIASVGAADLTLPDDAQVCSCLNVTQGRDLQRHPRQRADRRRGHQVVHQGRNRLRVMREPTQDDPVRAGRRGLASRCASTSR